jgi:hypothetical protein
VLVSLVAGCSVVRGGDGLQDFELDEFALEFFLLDLAHHKLFLTNGKHTIKTRAVQPHTTIAQCSALIWASDASNCLLLESAGPSGRNAIVDVHMLRQGPIDRP